MPDVDDALAPACWSWPITAEDLALVPECPESFGYVLLWNWQRGYCAICGNVFMPSEKEKPHRDHDHDTNRARGILCRMCNYAEGIEAKHARGSYPGWMWRNARLVEQVRRYRLVNPATLLGLVVRHTMTLAPKGVIVPRTYSGPLPIFRLPPNQWRDFYRATGSGHGCDMRLTILGELIDEYIERRAATK